MSRAWMMRYVAYCMRIQTYTKLLRIVHTNPHAACMLWVRIPLAAHGWPDGLAGAGGRCTNHILTPFWLVDVGFSQAAGRSPRISLCETAHVSSGALETRPLPPGNESKHGESSGRRGRTSFRRNMSLPACLPACLSFDMAWRFQAGGWLWVQAGAGAGGREREREAREDRIFWWLWL